MKNKIRILHVDDNNHDRWLVKDALKSAKDEFEIIEADNRETFEQHLSEHDFDLVLSDFNILGFDGLHALRLIKEKNADIPVIIVTGTGSEEVAVGAMKQGADDYVIKSVSHIQNLVSTVRGVLARKKIELDHKKLILALYESEEKYRLLFENSMYGILLTIPDGQIIEANQAACKLFGRTEEEMIKLGRNNIVNTSDPRLASAMKERASTGKFFGELTGLCHDGTPFPIEISSSVFHDVNGKTHSNIIIRDISERKEIEETLQKKMKHLERFHQLTVGRELVMIELKKEVNELLLKSGQPKKYN